MLIHVSFFVCRRNFNLQYAIVSCNQATLKKKSQLVLLPVTILFSGITTIAFIGDIIGTGLLRQSVGSPVVVNT